MANNKIFDEDNPSLSRQGASEESLPQGNPALPNVSLEYGVFHLDYGFKARVTKPSIEYAISIYKRTHGLEPAPVLLYGDRIIYVDYDAARYASESNVVELVESLALVAVTPLEKLLGQMFMQLHKPPYPVKVFDDTSAALKWSLEEKAYS